MSIIGLLPATKTSPPRLAPYETSAVALKGNWGVQESLEKVIPSQGHPPSLKMVASRRKHSSRPAITPLQSCSANLYGHIKRHCMGNLVRSRKQVTYLELKAVFLALKEFKTSVQARSFRWQQTTPQWHT